MKVHYGDHNVTAYLDDEPLSDGSYVGENKHSETPVHLRWDGEKDMWVQVCVREWEYIPPLYEIAREVGERPDCICKEEEERP